MTKHTVSLGDHIINNAPPVAERRPHSFTHHGITVEDPYHWLKDQGYPEVTDKDILAYVKAENDYFEGAMSPHSDLTEEIYKELVARQPKEDESVPWKDGDFFYQWKFEEGAQYRTWKRWREGREAVVILDEVELAKGHEFFKLGALSVSPDGKYLAYSTDTNGSERFTLFIKDLTTGEVLTDKIEETIGSPVWDSDSQTILYTIVNENWRPYQVKAHRLGEASDADKEIYTEKDESFFVGVGQTQSRAFITISTGDHVTNEVYVIRSDDVFAAPRLVSPRRTGHEYHLDHGNGRFVIRTNDKHVNFRIVFVSEDNLAEDNWQPIVEASDEVYIRDVSAFDGFLVSTERVGGLDQIRVLNDDGEHRVAFPETAYTASLGTNAEFYIKKLRLSYTSMVTPATVFDYDLASRSLETLKVQEVPGGYDPDNYETVRMTAPARDGVEVPVSVVYRKGFPKDQTGRLHIYAYGAYGHAVTPGFSAARLSLLDRGFAFAIAHIRGGDDLGFQWYLDGKLEKRTNTFNDFVDVSRFLVKEGYAREGSVSASGGSAGGELMGAVFVQAPELYGAIVAHVPFVDVLNTMLDTSLPLTPIEWPEWGNPIEDKAAFELIQSYSPYDQLSEADYPPIMLTAGLNDPRVTYWEAAKFIAKIRHVRTNSEIALLKTNMGAGHGGKSGRFTHLEEVAEEYVFRIRADR